MDSQKAERAYPLSRRLPKICSQNWGLEFWLAGVTSFHEVGDIAQLAAMPAARGGRLMDFRHLSDGIQLQDGHQGHEPPRHSTDTPHSVIDTGGNEAGNGGNGYFFGSLVNAPVVIYMPINIAVGGYNSSVSAEQSNTLQVDQSATQIAGVGGDGGNDNASIGGNVSASGFGGLGSGAISTGDNHAGNGGDGFFYGSLVNASFVLYHPINIAVAGPNSTVHAEQTNTVDINQSAFQMAGVGGNGGDGNVALGGDVVSGSGSGAGGIDTGGNGAGNGGDGYFVGSLVNAPVVIYMPINIAIGGYNSTVDAHQTNNVSIDQSVTQIAGIGGDGGSGNASIGGSVSASGFGSEHGHGWLNAGTISSGGNEAGNGGDGFFHGSIVNAAYTLFDPVNIAVAGANSSVHADQANDVELVQSVLQMAGLGGNGGNGNAALGGNISLDLSGFGFGSDVINTGHNEAGNGGNGHFSGSISNHPVAIFSPINIAMAGYNPNTDAHHGDIDHNPFQMAGVGGNVAAHFMSGMPDHFMPDHHLLLG